MPPRIPPYRMGLIDPATGLAVIDKDGKPVFQTFAWNEGPDYAHQEYPKWKYKEGEAGVIVNGLDEEMMLGDGWQDTDPVADKKIAETKAKLRQVHTKPVGVPSGASYQKFLEFQAWQEKQAKDAKAPAATPAPVKVQLPNDYMEKASIPSAPLNALALTPEEEKAVLIKAAEEKGITIDKRWGNERIKAELDKAKVA